VCVVTAKTFLIQESVQGLKGAYYKIKKRGRNYKAFYNYF
jgi:hypothetical protein